MGMGVRAKSRSDIASSIFLRFEVLAVVFYAKNMNRGVGNEYPGRLAGGGPSITPASFS